VHLSAGNLHDSTEAESALRAVPLEGSVVLADKAYGVRDIRSFIENSGAQYCIPPKSNERNPWHCDWWHYKERHVVECFFQKLKQFRRIATRFDKLASRFLAFVQLGSIMVWLA
jgi:transposase